MSSRTWQVLWLCHLADYEDIFKNDLFERYRDIVATRLVVEDDEEAAEFADRVEETISERAFDLVVVEGDQATPQVVRKLRDAGPALPVLLIATADEGERIVEAYDLGIDGYITRIDDEDVFRQLLAKQVFEHLSRDLDPPSTRRPTASELLRYSQYYNVLHPFFVIDNKQRLRYVNQAGREFIREAVDGEAELPGQTGAVGSDRQRARYDAGGWHASVLDPSGTIRSRAEATGRRHAPPAPARCSRSRTPRGHD